MSSLFVFNMSRGNFLSKYIMKLAVIISLLKRNISLCFKDLVNNRQMMGSNHHKLGFGSCRKVRSFVYGNHSLNDKSIKLIKPLALRKANFEIIKLFCFR